MKPSRPSIDLTLATAAAMSAATGVANPFEFKPRPKLLNGRCVKCNHAPDHMHGCSIRGCPLKPLPGGLVAEAKPEIVTFTMDPGPVEDAVVLDDGTDVHQEKGDAGGNA